MLKTVISTLTPNYSQLKSRSVFLLLSAISFVLRFPFFFRDYIDRDESTFILLGQSWVEGHLPYTELWDLKPPITYIFFAGIIAAFGKSFIAIRAVGVLIVAITAFFTFKIAIQLTTRKTAFWASFLCVCLLSMFGSLQGVMSEHICMFFFMPALYIVLSYNQWQWHAIAGLLFGLSVMTKLNMAYPVLIIGLYTLYIAIKNKNISKGLLHSFAFGTGIILLIFLTIIPYYIHGNTEIWWKSVILAPLEYTNARRYSIFKMAPIFIIIGTFFFFSWKNKSLNFSNKKLQLLLLVVFGILVSFIKGGRINGHYLIQLHPIFIILVAIVVSKITFFKKWNYQTLVFFSLVLLPMESYLEIGNIIKNKIQRGTFFNGEGISVPKYILDNNISTENILFLEYHIGYWQLGKLPLTKAATHPSNLCRDELFSFYDNPRKDSTEELRHIMEVLQPQTVVIRKGKRVFDKKELEENEYIDTYLSEHYTLKSTVERAEILQRLEGH
ncbi:glycosyltransferase family 39 protein [Maribacter sp.]|uniref:ArnT family glycosyltransferase n=1 Tax=Maribacter sp. TaxID=1897614 RepID=UPI0025BDA87E|nr:glycosyltransferase family 39 protein [Maribacter sp.]